MKYLTLVLLFISLKSHALEVISAPNGAVTINLQSGLQYQINGQNVTGSSLPVSNVGSYISTASLTSGDTVYSFVAESAITLKKLHVRNLSAGVGGGGDTLSCNSVNSAVSTMSVTLAAAAARETEGFSPSPASTVTVGTEIFCHYEGSSQPKPQFYFNLEYTPL